MIQGPVDPERFDLAPGPFIYKHIRLAPRLGYLTEIAGTFWLLFELTSDGIGWASSCAISMKNHAHNPASAFALCYAAMVCLAITVNLMPIFLTTLRVDLGGRAGLTGEQLGRISVFTFAGLVGGILFTGPLADRWGGKLFRSC